MSAACKTNKKGQHCYTEGGHVNELRSYVLVQIKFILIPSRNLILLHRFQLITHFRLWAVSQVIKLSNVRDGGTRETKRKKENSEKKFPLNGHVELFAK